jgi:cell division protein FtsI/penicillin-binding protein 2
MYTAFATGGEVIQPSLVRSIERGDERIVPPIARHRVLKQEVAHEVLSVLARVVEEGTGKSMKGLPWTVAAKTGTPKDTKTGAFYNPVVCAIAPATSPEIVVTVMHHGVRPRPGKPYTGGSVSGPVAKEIIEKTLTYLRVPGDR